jgi:hypothetical protein
MPGEKAMPPRRWQKPLLSPSVPDTIEDCHAWLKAAMVKLLDAPPEQSLQRSVKGLKLGVSTTGDSHATTHIPAFP